VVYAEITADTSAAPLDQGAFELAMAKALRLKVATEAAASAAATAASAAATAARCTNVAANSAWLSQPGMVAIANVGASVEVEISTWDPRSTQDAVAGAL